MTEPSTPELHADARAHFMATMRFEHEQGDEEALGRATVGPYLETEPGWPSVAVLLTFADVLVGRLASHRTAPRISVTADLGVRIVGPPASDGRLEMRATLIKTGRTMSVGETEFRSAGSGRLVATSIGTFLASPRPNDEVPGGFPPINQLNRLDRTTSPPAPTLVEQVGMRVLEPGLAEIALRPDLQNATESLQGGLVALLGEIAAQTGASDVAGTTHVVDSLDVYYLAAARVGPFGGQARVLSIDDRRGLVRVDIRDPGRDGRVAAVVVAGTRPLTV
jgi:acyl-coenzyme A thioesterase PaaI-like protein